jgi:hypothetical protein
VWWMESTAGGGAATGGRLGARGVSSDREESEGRILLECWRESGDGAEEDDDEEEKEEEEEIWLWW